MDDVRAAIEPIRPVLIRAHQDGVSTWKKYATGDESSKDFVKLGDTTRADFIHNLVCHDVANGVAGIKGVQVPPKLDFFAVLIGDSYLLRVKYLAGERPANSKSLQQEQLANQQFDDDLMNALDLGSHATPPLYVSCVYTLEGRNELASVAIRMDCIGREPWSFPIWGDGYEAAEPTTFTNMPPFVPARVTLKRKRSRKHSTNSGDEA